MCQDKRERSRATPLKSLDIRAIIKHVFSPGLVCLSSHTCHSGFIAASASISPFQSRAQPRARELCAIKCPRLNIPCPRRGCTMTLFGVVSPVFLLLIFRAGPERSHVALSLQETTPPPAPTSSSLRGLIDTLRPFWTIWEISVGRV